MSISILNNPASLAAQNQLGVTNSSLQKTLYQLSSGSRINSGADDAAGLAVANGLMANITALTQSARNASDGVGKLQVADGALAQVTTLLNRAVTLATESANGTLSDTQRAPLQAEFASIKSEIDRIGATTNFNGQQVFQNVQGTAGSVTTLQGSSSIGGLAANTTSNVIAGGLAANLGGTVLTPVTITLAATGMANYTFSADGTKTLQDLVTDINGANGQGFHAAFNSTSNILTITAPSQPSSAITVGGTGANGLATFTSNSAVQAALTVTGTGGSYSIPTGDYGTMTVNQFISNVNASGKGLQASLVNGSLAFTDTLSPNTTPTVSGASSGVTAAVGTFTAAAVAANTNVYLTDDSSNAANTIAVAIGALSSSSMNGASLASDNLGTQAGAQSALTDISSAINGVAALRGTLGASVNRLQSASNVINNNIQNLTSAQDNIMAADIPSTVASMSKYSILEQTGVAALSQANQMQQLVLKLIQ